MTIKEIMSQALRVPLAKIPDDAARGKLRSWDSLGHIELVTALETRFAIRFKLAEILKMTSIAEIVAVLRDKGVPDVTP